MLILVQICKHHVHEDLHCRPAAAHPQLPHEMPPLVRGLAHRLEQGLLDPLRLVS